MNYFDSQFEIGVALHACGSSTDLVLQKCISANPPASFVCCPCCYGSVQNNHMLHYPRSSLFQESGISLKHYFVLSHASDQTHDEENEKTEQGKLCMQVIDTDRCLEAQEHGYQTVYLKKIVPQTASPKNHILVGYSIWYVYAPFFKYLYLYIFYTNYSLIEYVLHMFLCVHSLCEYVLNLIYLLNTH